MVENRLRRQETDKPLEREEIKKILRRRGTKDSEPKINKKGVSKEVKQVKVEKVARVPMLQVTSPARFNITNAYSARLYLNRLVNLVHHGQMDKSLAGTLTYICNALLKAIDMEYQQNKLEKYMEEIVKFREEQDANIR